MLLLLLLLLLRRSANLAPNLAKVCCFLLYFGGYMLCLLQMLVWVGCECVYLFNARLSAASNERNNKCYGVMVLLAVDDGRRRPFVRSFGRSFVRSFGRSFVRSFVRSSSSFVVVVRSFVRSLLLSSTFVVRLLLLSFCVRSLCRSVHTFVSLLAFVPSLPSLLRSFRGFIIRSPQHHRNPQSAMLQQSFQGWSGRSTKQS